MMKKFLVSVLAISLIFAFTFPSAKSACAGVIACNETYPCGDSDGLCPEDFEGCANCEPNDPDCPSEGGDTGGGAGGGGALMTSEMKSEDLGSKEVITVTGASPQTYEREKGNFAVDFEITSFRLSNYADELKLSVLESEEGEDVERTPYRYWDIEVEGTEESNLENIKSRVKVDKGWMETQDIIPWTVKLLGKNGGGWNQLYLTKKGGDVDANIYKGESTEFNTKYVLTGERADIWSVLDRIDSYYSGDLDFNKTVTVISIYYS